MRSRRAPGGDAGQEVLPRQEAASVAVLLPRGSRGGQRRQEAAKD